VIQPPSFPVTAHPVGYERTSPRKLSRTSWLRHRDPFCVAIAPQQPPPPPPIPPPPAACPVFFKFCSGARNFLTRKAAGKRSTAPNWHWGTKSDINNESCTRKVNKGSLRRLDQLRALFFRGHVEFTQLAGFDVLALPSAMRPKTPPKPATRLPCLLPKAGKANQALSAQHQNIWVLAPLLGLLNPCCPVRACIDKRFACLPHLV
jgi:hypothetical protein